MTGAGEFLKESIEVLESLGCNASVFLSKAGEEVALRYGVLDKLREKCELTVDFDKASTGAGKVSLGKYDAVVVSPATANTVAKIANGIADNLVTTAVSLALKTGTKVIVVPTDWVAGEITIPKNLVAGGSKVHMKPRKSDMRNIEYLKEEGIIVLENPKEVAKELK
jgi:dihydromethanopterin reductase (acceptor)